MTDTTPSTTEHSELAACPVDLIAFKWAETLSPEEQDALLVSSLKRLQGVITARAVAPPVDADRPKIVCLCGSTRFMEAFQDANLRETLAGNIVLSVGTNTRSDADLTRQNYFADPSIKERLDALHFRKIELADEVLVINVGGYVGESTANEIAHATQLRKPIRYLESESTTTPSLPSVAPIGETRVVKDDVFDNWLKPMCSRLMHGRCTTLYCLKRGGYTGEPADASIATCEAYESYNALKTLNLIADTAPSFLPSIPAGGNSLAPCPFCAQPPDINDKHADIGNVWVGCPTSGCVGRMIGKISLERWNARAATPVVGEGEQIDRGVWFQSAVSGGWYQDARAVGDISEIRIDGATVYRKPCGAPPPQERTET